MRRLAALLALLACVLAPAAAQAASASLPDIEDEVMCVTCNVPLNIAESPQADRQRAFIEDLIAKGRTKEQIKAALVAQYSEDVLGTPDEDGFGLTAYLVPALLIVLLVGAVAVVVPRWRRQGRTGGPREPTAAALSPADADRLDTDLARYDA